VCRGAARAANWSPAGEAEHAAVEIEKVRDQGERAVHFGADAVGGETGEACRKLDQQAVEAKIEDVWRGRRGERSIHGVTG
jgi:Ni2+-binding GTPase involved in maturation of urease and hydrogenase